MKFLKSFQAFFSSGAFLFFSYPLFLVFLSRVNEYGKNISLCYHRLISRLIHGNFYVWKSRATIPLFESTPFWNQANYWQLYYLVPFLPSVFLSIFYPFSIKSHPFPLLVEYTVVGKILVQKVSMRFSKYFPDIRKWICTRNCSEIFFFFLVFIKPGYCLKATL